MQRGRKHLLLGFILGVGLTAVASVMLALLIPLVPIERHTKGTSQAEEIASIGNEPDSRRLSSDVDFETTQQPLSNNESSVTRNPGQLWKRLTTDDVSDAAQAVQLIETVVGWADQEGVEILEEVHSTQMDPALRETVMRAVLARTSELGWEKGFEQIAGLAGQSRNWAMDEYALNWARKEPRAALQTVSSLPDAESNRRVLQRIVARTWAETEPQVVLDDLQAIPENVRLLIEETAILAIAGQSPEFAIQFMPKFSGFPQEPVLAEAIAASWAEFDPTAALAWARSHKFSSELVRNDVTKALLRTYAKSEPEVALKVALETPLESTNWDAVGLEADVVEVVASRDIDVAIDMLARVRPGRTTQSAYDAVGSTLVVELQDFDRAIELGEKIVQNHRSRYYNVIAVRGASRRPLSLLEHLEKFPVSSRSSAAKQLLMHNRATMALTTKQIEQAKTYLNPTDRKAIESLPQRHTFVVRSRITRDDEH